MEWTLTAAAKEWGIDRKTLEKRLRAAGWEIAPRAVWHTRDVTAAIVGDLETERIRKTKEEADKLELDNAERRKELVRMDDAIALATKVWAPIASKVKDMPARLAGRCNPADPVLARTELEDYAREILEGVQERCSTPQS